MKHGFDEMFAREKAVRDHYRTYDEWLQRQPGDAMRSRREEAEMIFRLSLIHISEPTRPY